MKKSNISDINLIHLDDKTTQNNCSPYQVIKTTSV